MSDFKYTYKQLYGNKSQCEICHHDTCRDRGKRSMYDGEKHTCSRFQEYTKERQEEIAQEERDNSFDEYWKNFSLGPIAISAKQRVRNKYWNNHNGPEEDLEFAVDYFLRDAPSLEEYINSALDPYFGLHVVSEEQLEYTPLLRATTQKQVEKAVRLAYDDYVLFTGKATEVGSFSLFIGNEEIKIDVDKGDDEEILNQKPCQKPRYCK